MQTCSDQEIIYFVQNLQEMGNEVVLRHESEQILTLTINRPTALNAINGDVMQALHAAFGDVSDRDDLRGVIITGSGEKAFVAGADIKGFKFDTDSLSELGQFGYETFRRIEQCSVPVIAAVNGFALGGGCELAMACHMRVASANARFGQPEINLGIVPGYGGTQRLPQLIGKGKALELLLTADMIGAEEAKTLGLVNHVVEPGEEVSKAREILLKIAAKAPIAAQKIIELVNKHYYNYEGGLQAEITAFGECFQTEDAKEGVAAFIEKRKANFIGK